MRILHLSSEATWRGGEQQIIYLVEESLALGLEVIVACRVGSAVHRYCADNRLPHVPMPFRSAYDLATAWAIKRLCRKAPFDFIQMHSSRSHTVAVISGLLGNQTPLILTRRVDFPIKNNWFSRFKYNYGGIKKIICISDIIREITEPDVRDTNKLVVVKSGIDTHKFEPFKTSQWLRKTYQVPADHAIIGNSSAISDQKDYFTFVSVAELVRKNRPKTHFFIIGEGPMAREIKEFVRAKGLSDVITFTGFVPNIREVLPSLDIFLFTSKTEGLGTSILDAMAAGLPIVTTRAGGIPEMITHEVNGLLQEIADVDGLSQGVMYLLDHPEIADRFVHAAKERVKLFSKERTAQGTCAVYKQVKAQG